jgi:hypothetical protein
LNARADCLGIGNGQVRNETGISSVERTICPIALDRKTPCSLATMPGTKPGHHRHAHRNLDHERRRSSCLVGAHAYRNDRGHKQGRIEELLLWNNAAKVSSGHRLRLFVMDASFFREGPAGPEGSAGTSQRFTGRKARRMAFRSASHS